MKYQSVKAHKLKGAGIAVGLLLGSYLLAGLVNASPITHQGFSAVPRGRVVVVMPEDKGDHLSSEVPAESDAPALESRPTQSL